MTKNKMSRKIITVAVACIIMLTSSANVLLLYNNSASANSKTESAAKNAKAKMYYRALYRCIGGIQNDYSNVDFWSAGNYGNAIDTLRIAKEDWFAGIRSTQSGAFIEGEVDGSNGTADVAGGVDYQIYCSADNQLVATVVKSINNASSKEPQLSTWDLACGQSNGEGGVFTLNDGAESLGTCKDILQKSADNNDFYVVNDVCIPVLGCYGGGALVLDENRQSNYQKIVSKYISNPGTFTDLEMYYVYLLNFEAACTTYKNKNKAGEGEYVILDSNKKQKKYTKSKNKNVGLFQGGLSEGDSIFAYPDENGTLQKGKETCDNLAKYLGDENNRYTKAFLAASKKDEDDGEKVVESGSEETDPDTRDYGEKNEEDKCKKVSGLGWLLCPIIELVGAAIPKMYQNIIEPYLVFEPSLFGDSTKNGGIYEAWSYFAGFANIALVIFLLVIIFSQLTGFGIDNYGIKKTLPRLIIAALLINLSYIICQLAADVSNILGYSLNQLFENLASNVKGYDNIKSESGSVGAGIASASVGLTIIAGLVGLIIAFPEGALALLPGIIAALIGALIAIIFFFVVLGIRKAAVIVLIAISPLAFVCYMLPGTKKYFTKWRSLLTSLLLVYPAAGLLMGGGSFASAVMLSAGSDQPWVQIAALLVDVIPFFFLPSVVKGSLNGLGNIGNKISGFGRRAGHTLGGAAKRGIQSSNKFQAGMLKAQNKGAERRNKINTKHRNYQSRFQQGGIKGLKDDNLDYDKMSDDEKAAFDKKHLGLAMGIDKNNKTQEDYRKKLASISMGSRPENQTWNKQQFQTVEVDDEEEPELDAEGKPKIGEDGQPKMKKKEYHKEGDNWYDSNGNIQNEEMAKKLEDILAGKISIPEIEVDNIKYKFDEKNGVWRQSDNPEQIATGTTLDKLNQKMDELTAEKTGKRVVSDGRVYEKREVEETDEKGNKRKVSKWQEKNADGTYSDVAQEKLEGIERIAANSRLKALGGRTRTYRSDGFGDFEDAAGNKLSSSMTKSNIERLGRSGAMQSYDQILRMKEAQAKAQEVGELAGYAGHTMKDISRATLLNAESASISKMNQTLGNADAIQDVRRAGGITETTRKSAGQAAAKQVWGTAATNMSAAETILNNENELRVRTTTKIKDIENKAIEAQIEAANATFDQSAKAQLTGDEKVELIRRAKNGTLGEIASVNSGRSDIMKSVAQTLISDYGGASQYAESGSAEIKERIDNALVNLASGSSVTTQDKLALTKAMKNGTVTQDIINNPNMSDQTKAIATRLLEKNGNNELWTEGSSQIKNAIDATAMGRNIATKKGESGDIAIPRDTIDTNSIRNNIAINASDVVDDAIGSTGLLNSQIQQGATTGTVKLQNQFKQETAGNAVGEVEMNMDVVKHQAQNAKIVKKQEQQAYANALNDKELQENGQSLLTIKEDKAYNQAQRRIFSTAAQNMLDETAPDFKTIRYDVQVKRKNDETKAMEAKIFSETTTDGRKIVNDINGLRNRLIEASRNGNEIEQIALVNILSEKGENGQEAVRDVLATLASEPSTETAQYAIASRIVNNYGSMYKNATRSTFDRAQQILSGGDQVWDSDVATNIASLTAEKISGTNDRELERYASALENGKLTQSQENSLKEIIDIALDPNGTIRTKIKPKQLEIINRMKKSFGNVSNAPEPPKTIPEKAGAGDGEDSTSFGNTHSSIDGSFPS